ncbi:restriction endonuclease subunit S [Escherichia coli]|nr:restriction endonuclease subunit S [Escherichia coli]HAX9849529.1 restriction endonuclease subunit S [Escherichia coli]
MSLKNIPTNWCVTTIGDINDYKSLTFNPKSYQEDSFELYSVPSFASGSPEILLGKDIASNKQYIQFKDILLCKINPRINRVWCVKEKKEHPQIGSSEWIVIRQPLIHEGFLAYFLQTQDFRDLLCSDVSGVGGSLTRAQPKRVATYNVPIAPLPEQKIIAEKLDTLLAQVESTKARLEQIPQILKRFRQAVLGTAMSGNLTGEWRLSNHSIILAEEIEENKNRLIEKKLVKKDLTYASLDKRYSLPPSWLYIKLQSVSTKITDGEHKTPKRETAGKFLLSARNIQDGYIKLADVDYVGDAEFQKLRNRCDPDYGDILISCSGSIGRVCLVDENSKYVMVRSVALVKLMQDFVINKYMMFLLQSPLLQKEIEENSKSTAQSNLFLGPIKNLGIPLPPVSEQHEIVRRVEQLFAYADTIEKQVNNALARVNNLTQSILAKAFRGELTAQWRAENPELISGENSATALLEKIKAERAASGGKKASRKKS